MTLDVQAREVVVDTAGVETEVPMDEWVEIGVFAPVEEGEEELREPLYIQMHRIRSGEQTITVTVPRKPARAGFYTRRGMRAKTMDRAVEKAIKKVQQATLVAAGHEKFAIRGMLRRACVGAIEDPK